MLRRLLETAREIQIKVTERKGEPQHLMEDAERRLFEVAHAENAGDFRSIDEILHDEIDKLERLSRDGQPMTGTPSGFRDLDDITGGFQQSNLIVLAARPSMGKSALVTNIAENVAVKHGKPGGAVLARDVRDRARAALRRQPGEDVGRQAAQGPGARRATGRRSSRPARRSSKAPLWIDDSSDIDILELRAKARRLHVARSSQRTAGSA